MAISTEALSITAVKHDPRWLNQPDDLTIGMLHGIIQLPDASILIQNACEDNTDSCLLRCDVNGNILSTRKLDALAVPHGLELYQHPKHGSCLLHADNKNGIVLTNLDNEVIWQVERTDFYKLHWLLNWSPSNCGIASDGRIYLADGYGSFFISVFDADGNQLDTFGGPKTDGTGIIHPHGCAVIHYAGEEVLAVTECQLSSQDADILQKFDACSCIKLFSLDGEFLKRIKLDTISPRHIRPWGSEHYIIPDFQGRLLITDLEFRVITSIGTKNNKFSQTTCEHTIDIPRPHDCCQMNENTLLVTDFTGLVHKIEL